ncbi:MAG: DNA polymerase [Eubacterium coprostanoligenes]|nr:DNA polymerase [Eubacterium coprostanoligenes]
MKTLSIDIETYSDVDLNKAGVYKYSSSPRFEILLFAYSLNGEKVKVVDLVQGESIPNEVVDAIFDDEYTKFAFNSNFERVCLSRYFHTLLTPDSWRCTMVWSAYMGLPLSLKGVGVALKLDEQKMSEGKELIKFFCSPCLPTKANGGRTRNMPYHAPEKWELFKKYNIRDVEVEMAIQKKLSKVPVPDFVWDEYHIDQEINDRGILVDMDFVESAIAMDEKSHNNLMIEIQNLTGLENPNSVQQMKSWLKERGIDTDSLSKKTVKDLLQNAPDEIKPVLEIRQQLAKSSVKKYQAMQSAACEDNRCKGMFQFYGANRSGRFAGRIVQLQNLPQNHIDDLELARQRVKDNNIKAVQENYESVADTLSQLIRTAFIPKHGYKFIVADYSAIEARVIAWLAGEEWRLEAFKQGKDIYCASASQMFGVPVEKNGVNGDLRQKGKIAELALGYGGSVGALTAMGALDIGLKESELKPLVDAWRSSNQKITALWWAVDRAAKEAVIRKTAIVSYGIKFEVKYGILFVHLPSGRCLSYCQPKIGKNQFGEDSVTYMGIGTNKKWQRIESYGPKFVENIVQGIARDLLCFAMRTLKDYRIVAHVHDELIIECPRNTQLNDICEQMAITPEWANGLLLRADGYECQFYKKD